MDTKQLNTSPVCAEVSLFAQDPLPHNEVRHIAKSISKWTATHQKNSQQFRQTEYKSGGNIG
ncbi:MAG: primase C-terminal domain-containing protein [Corynebacterium sp.]|nr:primase C-terminal domain-containing protein [Corynebacterium sp.]